MTQPPTTIRIWLAVSHHAVFRCGGWAYVRSSGSEVSGAAGGARQIMAERADLMALTAALAGLAPDAAVTVHTASVVMLGLGAVIAGEAEAPTENLDLLAQVAVATAGRAVRFVRVEAAPGSPAAFTAAWAELARDKAKVGGPFSAAIPKPNLAKSGI